MEKRRIPGGKPSFPAEDVEKMTADFREIITSGAFIKGKHVTALETDFAKYVGAKYAVTCNSATTALQMLYQYYDVKGKEVIVQNNTFLSTAYAVLYAGGTPVFTDTDPRYLSAGLKEIEARVTEKTRGVALVHVAGHIHPDIQLIKDFCKKKNLFLIEDASHAHGSSIDGRKAGVLADAACFSFYPTKVMTTAMGGIITTDDEKLIAYVKSVREHGNENGLTNIVRLGNQWLMTEPHALIGVYGLKNLDAWVKRRNEIAKKYTELLKDVPEVRPILPAGGTVSAYYKYLFVLDKGIDREKVQKHLKEQCTIDAGDLYWPTCHAQPLMRTTLHTKDADYPQTMDVMPRMLTLPIYVTLSDDDIAYVIRSLKEAIASARR